MNPTAMTPEDEAAAAAEAEARKAAEGRAMRFTAPAGWGKSVADVTSALTNPPPESDDDHPENHRRDCLLYTSPSPRDQRGSRMPSSA